MIVRRRSAGRRGRRRSGRGRDSDRSRRFSSSVRIHSYPLGVSESIICDVGVFPRRGCRRIPSHWLHLSSCEGAEVDIILVAGLWMGGWAWYEVAPALEQAGHRPVALTLPGMESADADRSAITLDDHVAAVVAAIDAAPGEKVVLVGHSAGAGIVYAAADARPHRVARLILIGGFPTPDGAPLLSGYTPVGGELPLPDWSDFDEADLRDLGQGGMAAFRAYAIPHRPAWSPASSISTTTGVARSPSQRWPPSTASPTCARGSTRAQRPSRSSRPSKTSRSSTCRPGTGPS